MRFVKFLKLSRYG